MQFILIIHIILAVLMIGLILIQHGKGADAGASMNGGGAGTVFGSSGSGNFLSRSTAILTTLFFITSISLAVLAKKQSGDQYKLSTAPVTTQAPVETPAQPLVNNSTTAFNQPQTTENTSDTTPNHQPTPAENATNSTENTVTLTPADDVKKNDENTASDVAQGAMLAGGAVAGGVVASALANKATDATQTPPTPTPTQTTERVSAVMPSTTTQKPVVTPKAPVNDTKVADKKEPVTTVKKEVEKPKATVEKDKINKPKEVVKDKPVVAKDKPAVEKETPAVKKEPAKPVQKAVENIEKPLSLASNSATQAPSIKTKGSLTPDIQHNAPQKDVFMPEKTSSE